MQKCALLLDSMSGTSGAASQKAAYVKSCHSNYLWCWGGD